MKIRLMTANVWADVFGNPVSPRDRLLTELIGEIRPDAIFFQEMHPHWHSSILKPFLFGMDYRESLPELHGNPRNYTPVFYRNQRFTEVRNLFRLYTGPNDYDSKFYAGSVLRDKETGRCFSVFSTHMHHLQTEAGNAAREQNARELIRGFDELGQDISFCGGDYNCDVHSSPFGILNGANIVCSSVRAENKENFIRTDHLYPTYDPKTERYTAAPVSGDPNDLSIDHIAFRGSAAVRNYRVITDERARIVSDHCPVVVDFEF